MAYLHSQILIPILIPIPSCNWQLEFQSESVSVQCEKYNVAICFIVRIAIGILIRQCYVNNHSVRQSARHH